MWCCVYRAVVPVLARRSLVFFSSRRRHTRSVSAFLLNRSSDLSDNSQGRGGQGVIAMKTDGERGKLEIGRASCRERVEISGGAVSLKKKKDTREASHTAPIYKQHQGRDCRARS